MPTTVNFGIFDKKSGVGVYYTKTPTKASPAYIKDYRPPVPIAMTGCLDLHAGSLALGVGSYIIGGRSHI